MPFIMKSLWFLSGLRFGRSSPPIIKQWTEIAEKVQIYQGCLWHCIWHDKCRLSWQAFDFYRGYVLGEARLPPSGSEWSWFLSTYEACRLEDRGSNKDMNRYNLLTASSEADTLFIVMLVYKKENMKFITYATIVSSFIIP